MFIGGELSRTCNLDGTKADTALARTKVSSPKKNAAPPTGTATAAPTAEALLDQALEEHRAKTEDTKSRQLSATGEALQLKDKPEREVGTQETQTLSEIEVWNALELGCAEYLALFKT